MIVAVFGSTGTAGSGAVQACLTDSRVTEVRAVTRRPLGLNHDKLVEVTCSDFANLAPVAEQLAGVDVCLFCLGVSASKVSDEMQYRVIHVDYALAAAHTLQAANPNLSFVYLSGSGTNRRSRMMWARVKAEGEDRLAELGLSRLVCVRPGWIVPADAPALTKVLGGAAIAMSMGIGANALGRAMLRAGTDRGVKNSKPLNNRVLRTLAM